MTDGIGDAESARDPSRRAVLAGGAALAASGLFTAIGTAQGTITGVIPNPEFFEDADLAGFLIRIDDPANDATTDDGAAATADGGQSTDTVELAGRNTPNGTEQSGSGGTPSGSPSDCDFRDWPPADVTEHNGVLVDRKEEGESPSVDTTVHVGADADVSAGDRYLVNRSADCGGGYVGVALESVPSDGGPAEAVDDFEQTDRTADGGAGGGTEGEGDGGSGATTPGFGVAGALGGLAALSGWLARRRSE